MNRFLREYSPACDLFQFCMPNSNINIIDHQLKQLKFFEIRFDDEEEEEEEGEDELGFYTINIFNRPIEITENEINNFTMQFLLTRILPNQTILAQIAKEILTVFMNDRENMKKHILFIANALVEACIENRDNETSRSNAFLLSRIIHDSNVFHIFYVIFSDRCKWLDYSYDPTPDAPISYTRTPTEHKEIMFVFKMIIEWFSYSTKNIWNYSIPIVKTLIQKNIRLEKPFPETGLLIEAFFETTGYQAFIFFKSDLDKIINLTKVILESLQSAPRIRLQHLIMVYESGENPFSFPISVSEDGNSSGIQL